MSTKAETKTDPKTEPDPKVEVKTTPKVDPKVEVKATPDPKVEVKPEPTPTTKVEAKPEPEPTDDPAGIVARMEQALRDIEAREARVRDAALVQHLRSLGAKPFLTDQNLLAMVQDKDKIDVSTSAGKVLADGFREANGHLFEAATTVPDVMVTDRLRTPEGAPDHPIFGSAFVERNIRSLFGGTK